MAKFKIKQIALFALLLILFISAGLLFTACKKKDNEPELTGINVVLPLAEAETLYNNAITNNQTSTKKTDKLNTKNLTKQQGVVILKQIAKNIINSNTIFL